MIISDLMIQIFLSSVTKKKSERTLGGDIAFCNKPFVYKKLETQSIYSVKNTQRVSQSNLNSNFWL